MFDSFVIVPPGDFRQVADRIVAAAADDPAVFRVRRGKDTLFFFGGEGLPLPDLWADELETTRRIEMVLTSLRISEISRVIHVRTLGYEASAEHLQRFLVWLLVAFSPCTVFDDESGEDLTEMAARYPSRLVFPNDEAEATKARSRAARGAAAVAPASPPPFALPSLPMPGVPQKRQS